MQRQQWCSLGGPWLWGIVASEALGVQGQGSGSPVQAWLLEAEQSQGGAGALVQLSLSSPHPPPRRSRSTCTVVPPFPPPPPTPTPSALQVNLALKGLPQFKCLQQDLGQHRTTTHLLPDEGEVLAAVTQAFEDVRQVRMGARGHRSWLAGWVVGTGPSRPGPAARAGG